MENSQKTCFGFRRHTPIPLVHPIGNNYRLCSMCLYVVWLAAVEPCIPSRAIMEARCLPVCLSLIINSLTHTFSHPPSSLTACYERIRSLSLLQTSGSVSKVRWTNWLLLVALCLYGEGGRGQCSVGARVRGTRTAPSLQAQQATWQCSLFSCSTPGEM